MAYVPRFCALQVCNCSSLYAKKNDNPYLLLLPCPQVLCEIAYDCLSIARLLLCCGDVETNPGPTTRSEALLDVECLPDEPSEQMTVLFNLLKDLQARSIQSAKCQTDLAADVKAIKAGQKSIETKIGCIQKRLDELEEKTNSLDHFGQDIANVQGSVKVLAAQHNSLQSRFDELEDRSRRDNLIFHGIPDSRESWEQTESQVKNALAGIIDTLPDNAIERPHRLGPYLSNKCRPIIVKFSSYKIKDSILSARAKLKEKSVAVNEDFSPATRHARKKLIEFAKSQTGAPPFQLRYNKLLLNKKRYVYAAETDNVIEL
ncbi:unnamed protein product, partial [Ixodes hexagonus]